MERKFAILLLALVVSLVLLFGCTAQPKTFACNKPYIQVGSECCLDQNDNKICDKDEQKQPPQPQQQQNQTPPKQPEPAVNKTKENVREMESNKSNTTGGFYGCSISWKGGSPEFIPAGKCSGFYDENTLVRPWCNPEKNTLEENCDACGCADQLPCIMGKCERPEPNAPDGAISESSSGNFGGLELTVEKVYPDHTADLGISYQAGGVTQSEIAKIGYGKNIARKVANAWYANLSMERSGFMPTGTTYPDRGKSWAIITRGTYATECVPLYIADVLQVFYLDGNEHKQQFDVSPSWSDVRGWAVLVKDYKYYDSREDKTVSLKLNSSAADIAQSGVMMAECGFDSRQVSVRLSSGRLFDYSK